MRIFLILICSVLLSACAGTGDPIQRQPEVKVEAVTHQIAIQLQGNHLTESDKAALAEFVYQHGQPAALRIRIDTYTRNGKNLVPVLTGLLKEWAIYPSQVSTLDGKHATSSADFSVLVESYRSIVPDCRAGQDRPTLLNRFYSNENFGCANANSLAQMVANPRDLIVGHVLDATEGRKAVSGVESYYQPSSGLANSNATEQGMAANQGGK